MSTQIKVVYENGVLRPLQPLELAEHEVVTVIISPDAGIGRSQFDVAYLARLRKELEAEGAAPGLEEVRHIMSNIPGNWSGDFIAERGEFRDWPVTSSIRARS